MHPAENPYIYGLHDRGGEHLLVQNGEAKGWVVVTEAIGTEPHERGGGDYSDLANKGLGVIVRLNQSYGPNGTIPREERYPDFAQRVANFVEDSRGAHLWIIGNEMNLEREQPRKPGSHEAEVITPRRYATCYKLCRQKIRALPGHENDLVLVGSIGPWNGETSYEADPQRKYPANKIQGGPEHYPYRGFFGDFIHYMRDILLAIGPADCDGITIHAYSHGYDAAMVFNTAKMGWPFEDYYFNFYTFKDQMEAIPADMRHLPVYLTEANGDVEEGYDPNNPNQDKNQFTWPFGNNGWVKNAYSEINKWNQAGNQQIRCMVLFRWIQDHLGWSIVNKPGVHQDLQEAMARNYRWQETVAEPEPEPEPIGPDYRTEFVRHDTPARVAPNQAVSVPITLKNAGGNTWTAGNFNLAYQWYDDRNQMVELPGGVNIRTGLPQDVAPGESVNLQANLHTPPTVGQYMLRWDMLHEGVTWFTSQGDQGLLIPGITVQAVVERPQPEPEPEPEPEPQPEPEPEPREKPKPAPAIEIEDVSADLPRSDTEQYPRRSLDAIERVVIHHTGTAARLTVQRLARFQVNRRNLPGITHHFCVDYTGRVFQTQPLEVEARHAGSHSADSVGIYLIGDFSEEPPPQLQLNATSALLAYLADKLDLSLPEDVVGYSELVPIESPGKTWPRWKEPLLTAAQALREAGISAPAGDRPIEHYLLLPHDSSTRNLLLSAVEYIRMFPVTIGFSPEEAALAQHVTILGDTGGISAQAEQTLQQAGAQVERLDGDIATVRELLSERVAAEQRFRTQR